MHLTTWAAFTLAYSLMAFTPGPVIMLVISYALTQGRRTALVIVAGTTLGDSTSLTAAVLGVGALLEASALSFTILKLAGAAYLVFLGVRLWRQRLETPTADADAASPVPLLSLRKAFLHAYLSTTLNPKSVLFFMIFVPQFLDPAAPLAPQLAAMLASVAVFGGLIDGGYSLFAAKIGSCLQGRGARLAINRVAGGVLIGEGAIAATWRGLGL